MTLDVSLDRFAPRMHRGFDVDGWRRLVSTGLAAVRFSLYRDREEEEGSPCLEASRLTYSHGDCKLTVPRNNSERHGILRTSSRGPNLVCQREEANPSCRVSPRPLLATASPPHPRPHQCDK